MVTAQPSPGAAKTPRSPGDAPAVETDRRVYAIGDIHGRLDLLEQLHALIAADARDAETGLAKVLVYLGDYVDRGPESKGVVEALARPGLSGFEAVHLKGNHEDMMVRFLDEEPDIGDLWIANGGAETLASYGIDVPWRSDGAGLTRAGEDLRRLLPAAHLEFMRRLRSWYRDGDYLFVHAGVRAGVAIEAQEDADLLWIRGGFLDCDDDLGDIVVHGHTPTVVPDRRSNRIGIDTGAVFTGRLTCLVLEGTDQRFLSTEPDERSFAASESVC